MMKRAILATGLVTLSTLVGLASLAWPGLARAQTRQDVGLDAGPSEADDLARAVAREAEALSTDDCTSACRALSSMRRATERLCALEPGKRCDDARRILGESTRQVRAACPGCAIHADRAPEEAPRPAPPPAAAPPPATPGAAPESMTTAGERRSGSCAGCTTVPRTTGARELGAALALGLALVLRARRRGRR